MVYRWFIQERTLSSQRRGKCNKISIGSVSAVRMMISAMPRFKVFVAEGGCISRIQSGETGCLHLR